MGRPNRTEWDEIEILVSNIDELKELVAYNNFILREVDQYVERFNKRNAKESNDSSNSSNSAVRKLWLLPSCDGDKESTT